MANCPQSPICLTLIHSLSPLSLPLSRHLYLTVSPPLSLSLQYIASFEIYGGKVFDLLNKRSELPVREDAKKKINIVNLREAAVCRALFASLRRAQKAAIDGTCARTRGRGEGCEEDGHSPFNS